MTMTTTCDKSDKSTNQCVSQNDNFRPEGQSYHFLKIISPPEFLILTKPLYLSVFMLAIVSQLAVAQLRLIIELELRIRYISILLNQKSWTSILPSIYSAVRWLAIKEDEKRGSTEEFPILNHQFVFQ